MSNGNTSEARIKERYYLFLKLIRRFLSELNLLNSISIDISKLYQAIDFYFKYSDMVKSRVGCGNTNHSKKCAFTLYALNKYRPLYTKNNNTTLSHLLLYINEYLSLYLAFNHFPQRAFRKLFMLNKDMIYLLENYQLNPEQFMIMLDIHYIDYNNIIDKD